MLKRNGKEKLPDLGKTFVFRKLEASQTTSDHSLAENVNRLRAVPLDIRKREASERLYLDRYE